MGLLGDTGGDQILLHARGSHTAGAWFSLENTSTDGKRWDFISTGSTNGGGAGNLLFRHAAVGSVPTLTPAGRAGVGTVSPIAKLDVVDIVHTGGGSQRIVQLPGDPDFWVQSRENLAHFDTATTRIDRTIDFHEATFNTVSYDTARERAWIHRRREVRVFDLRTAQFGRAMEPTGGEAVATARLRCGNDDDCLVSHRRYPAL